MQPERYEELLDEHENDLEAALESLTIELEDGAEPIEIETALDAFRENVLQLVRLWQVRTQD